MEAVVDAKYRPALYRYGGGTVEPKKLASSAWGQAIEPAAGVYLECLRNHAASAGGYVVDGCGEFMPAPAPAADPAALLRCAACGCHRSFHRRMITEGGPLASSSPSPRLALLLAPPPPPAVVAASAPHLPRGEGLPAADGWDETDEESSDYDDGRPASPLSAPGGAPPSGGYLLTPVPPPTLLPSLNTVAPAASVSSPASYRPPAPVPQGTVMVPGGSLAAARKRFRTRFSPEQKQRMRELSERLGWRLQKREEAAVEACCREIGVPRRVFKVWMHNNKHNFVGGGNSARRATASSAPVPVPAAAAPVQPSAATPPPTAPRPPVVHADFNININRSGAADYYVLQPVTATMSGGAPQPS